jgi:hypothetical protein
MSTLTASLFFLSVPLWAQINACDLAVDGKIDVADVQAAINMSLGVSPCTADIAGLNLCNVVVVQRVINASLGGGCITSLGLHSVSLTWTASTSTGITGYKVYRATTTTGTPSLIASLGATTSYIDNSVVSGLTYYYTVTAVDGSGKASPNSNQAQAVIPIP